MFPITNSIYLMYLQVSRCFHKGCSKGSKLQLFYMIFTFVKSTLFKGTVESFGLVKIFNFFFITLLRYPTFRINLGFGPKGF